MSAAMPGAMSSPRHRAGPLAWGCMVRWRAGALWFAVFAPFPWAAGAQGQAPPPALNETIAAGSVLRLLGRDVTGPKGDVVAQVMNVLVDATGQPQAAVLDYGGFLGVGKRRIAVAWRALRFAPDQQTGAITLGLGPDQLKAVPEFKPDGPIIVAAPPEPIQPEAPPPAQD